MPTLTALHSRPIWWIWSEIPYEPGGVGLCVQGLFINTMHLIRCRPAMTLHKYMNPVLLL
jgi:hypothetical protein